MERSTKYGYIVPELNDKVRFRGTNEWGKDMLVCVRITWICPQTQEHLRGRDDRGVEWHFRLWDQA